MYPTLSQLVSIEMMNIILLSRGEVRSWWNTTQGRLICKNNKKEERKGCVHKQSVCKTYPKGHRQKFLHRKPGKLGTKQTKPNPNAFGAFDREFGLHCIFAKLVFHSDGLSPTPSSSAMSAQPLSVPGTSNPILLMY